MRLFVTPARLPARFSPLRHSLTSGVSGLARFARNGSLSNDDHHHNREIIFDKDSDDDDDDDDDDEDEDGFIKVENEDVDVKDHDGSEDGYVFIDVDLQASMDRTRIARVDNVTLCRRGDQVSGSLHITPHHLIFSHVPPNPSAGSAPARPKEIWITYPLIAQCTLRPYPSTTAASGSSFSASAATTTNANPPQRHPHRPSHIRLQCRDFAFFCFYFVSETDARETFESIRNFTCKLGRIERLYAFTYRPMGNEAKVNGWSVYDPRKEWERMGVEKCGWRISKINADYNFSPTYPALLPVPATISDNTINYAGRYRSRARIPVLTYLHPVNNCSITRSSQPMTGIRQHRSAQDEKLMAEIFLTTSNSTISKQKGLTGTGAGTGTATPEHATPRTHFELSNAEELEDAMISSIQATPATKQPSATTVSPVYGATQHNLIVDARPTVNAMAMQALGAGSESMDNYSFATKAYLGIDNIHVMRESLHKVYDALKDSDISSLPPSKEILAKTGWLKHIGGILDGASLIARQVGLNHSHVLIHCSDGWDRTSQLSALAQLCLEPYYRTFEGFMVLVEKDWLAFGHNFRLRGGVLGSKEWFKTENSGMSMPGIVGGGSNEEWRDSEDWSPGGQGGGGGGAGKAIENAFNSAKGFFNRGGDRKEKDLSEEGTTATDIPEATAAPSTRASSRAPSTTAIYKPSEFEVVNPKETSPVFHQFLDATYQLLYQHPDRFQFNERFLRRLLYHSHSAQYGTFLFNSEKERVDMHASERTRSVWDYFLARKDDFINPSYDPTIDDNVRGKERLLFPKREEIRWWSECFNRPDAEMNYPTPSQQQQQQQASQAMLKRSTSVLAGVEAAGVSRSTDEHAGGMMPGNIDIGATMSTGIAALAAGLSSLGMRGGSGGGQGDKTKAKAKEEQSPQSQSGSQSRQTLLSEEELKSQKRQSQLYQQQQHSQYPYMPPGPDMGPSTAVEEDDHDSPDLDAPAFYRDPLADEVRELYARVRKTTPRVEIGRPMDDSVMSSDSHADILAPSTVYGGDSTMTVGKGEGHHAEDSKEEQEGEPVKPRNPLLDPLLGEEATDITFLGSRGRS